MDVLPGADMGDQWLEGFIPYLLYRATMKSNDKMLTMIRRQRINPSQWRVLSVLKSFGTLSMSAISEHTCMDQSTISRAVAQLESSGRVERRPSAADARVAEICLTSKGDATFTEILPTALRHQELAVTGLTKKQLSSLITILSIIDKNMSLYD